VQTDRLVGSERSLAYAVLPALLVGALLAACGGAWAAAADENVYLFEDVLITGRGMHGFPVGDEMVNVVLGDFSLTVGRRAVTGRDAVIWIKERSVGSRILRDITVYVEGDPPRPAQVVEPDGTVTRDRVLLVVIHQQGGLRARVGGHSDQPVTALPLYRRARAMRSGLAEPPVREVATQPTEPAESPKPRRLIQPIFYRADVTSVRTMPDPRRPERQIRITVAKGNAYVSQGHRDSDLFVEMQADAAVVYSIPTGSAAETPEEQLGQEDIVAVYLEGDVILRRGERTVQGERLFYDFQMGKALMLQPVLRTIQSQRDIPVYIRAKEGRQLAARPEPGKEQLRLRGYEWTFRDAIVTTSDFFTPTYHIGAKRVYLADTTPYDAKGTALAERTWRTRLVDTTLNIRSVPVAWFPYLVGDAQEGHTALRKAEFGRHGRFGWGAETQWFLFRLLGLPRPEGFKGRLDADWYERGYILGTELEYERESYSGYGRADGLIDREREDDFGTRRKNINAREERGRLLWRHKHLLGSDWELQLEASYLSDKNFLEQFFPGEYWTGKEQETLAYARKQRDNWAVTGLAKWRLNDFLTQTEALPDLGAYLVGQSLWKDILTLHGEGHMGLVRLRPADDGGMLSSRTVARADVRQEIDLPMALGPIKVLPHVAGRLTYWEDSPADQGLTRPWGQVGVNALTHVWRVYDRVRSRLWDLNRLKHVVTPFGGVFWSCTEVEPGRAHPFSPEIEGYVRRLGGGTAGIRQLWQTKRGPPGEEYTVDWLRANVSASFFNDADTHLPADGRYFFYRPEYSMPRNALNGDMTWHVSDSTTLLADANYDTDSGRLGRANAGIAVTRDPRLKYYAGARYIKDLDSSVGTFGLTYRISRKYTISGFQQYDFDLQGGQNLITSATITRKFPRFYTAFTFVYDRSQNDVGLIMSIWPEGVPEARIGGSRLSLLQAASERD